MTFIEDIWCACVIVFATLTRLLIPSPERNNPADFGRTNGEPT